VRPVRPCEGWERGGGGLAMARGALDEFPLFWRCANVVRCDTTEDVELGCKHRDPVGCRMHCGLSEGADP